MGVRSERIRENSVSANRKCLKPTKRSSGTYLASFSVPDPRSQICAYVVVIPNLAKHFGTTSAYLSSGSMILACIIAFCLFQIDICMQWGHFMSDLQESSVPKAHSHSQPFIQNHRGHTPGIVRTKDNGPRSHVNLYQFRMKQGTIHPKVAMIAQASPTNFTRFQSRSRSRFQCIYQSKHKRSMNK